MHKLFVLLLLCSQVAVAASQQATLQEGKNFFRSTPLGPKGELLYGEEAFTGDAMPATILNPNMPNNKVLVKTRFGVNRKVNRSYVAVRNGCANNICVGDKVITGRLSNATVLAHFEDGTFITRDSRETTRWGFQDLALQEGCTLKFCMGDTVLTTKGKEHFIAGFFGNGDYLIRNYKGKASIQEEKNLILTNAICRNIPIKRKGLCHNH